MQVLFDQGKLLLDAKSGIDVAWEAMYGLMIEYGRRTGTCNVPRRWREFWPEKGIEVNLGRWVAGQKEKRFTTLSPEHRERLQELVDQGLFQWRASGVRERDVESNKAGGDGEEGCETAEEGVCIGHPNCGGTNEILKIYADPVSAYSYIYIIYEACIICGFPSWYHFFVCKFDC